MEKQVSVLTEELESLKKKFERTEKLLEKAVFERDSSSKYVESFREQVSQLHEKLAAERKKNKNHERHFEQKQEDQGLLAVVCEIGPHFNINVFKVKLVKKLDLGYRSISVGLGLRLGMRVKIWVRIALRLRIGIKVRFLVIIAIQQV